jgi:hypothetical protein
MAFESASGITFSFSGTTYTATSINYSESFGELDETSLGSTRRQVGHSDLAEVTLKVDFIGGHYPSVQETGTLRIHGFQMTKVNTSNSHAVVVTDKQTAATNTTNTLTCPALCSSLSQTFNVGDLYTGSATFKLTVPDKP